MGHNFSFCQTCETPLDCDFCDKLTALLEPGYMTLEELKAEAKRQGYKLIKDENATVRAVLVRAQRPSVVQRAGRLDGVLQALRT